MKKIVLLIFLSLFIGSLTSLSQVRRGKTGSSNGNVTQLNDSLRNKSEITVTLSGKTKYTDYKIISHKKDTTVVDTTLTIQKEYKYNFLRKDNFELLAFHNQGQTFNNLGYNFRDISAIPDIGFRAKQFGYFNVEDVKYYKVPTPTTEILYRTGLQQGQVLDAIFTLNFNPRLNVAMSYKGLRSLGQYRRALVSSGNFRGSFHYTTKESQYSLKGHITVQDILNQESGGLTDERTQSFIDDDPEYSSRDRLDVNLIDTENLFEGERYYFQHDFKLLGKKDSLKQKDFTNLKIGHTFSTENKRYNFTQGAVVTAFFGNVSETGAVNETVENRLTSNQFFLEFNSKYILGTFKAKIKLSSYEYGYNRLVNKTIGAINNTDLTGDAVSFGADWKGRISDFQVIADATVTPGSGRLAGNHFKGEMQYKKDSLFTIKGSLLLNSKSPNFNFLLHQSVYDSYNWENNFNNINTRNLGFNFNSKWINTSVDFTNIENYTYFDETNAPKQTNQSITYLKVKANKEFNFWKLYFDNTIMYQNVSSGSSVFRVPQLVTRNTLYYHDSWFKGDPMQVQIGATFKYFSKYKANAYNPLLAEFTLQNTTEIGYPTIDLFFNARVRRTRIFFKIENAGAGFGDKNYFSAPNYPYRDLVIRFGLVWNWFI
ncbi:putative beta-barrel porin [Lutibacter sp. Hel_I_33_5]|uniref:putative porin n=1 Tax=Lutibacter sp. Hel_I_33_5 TaxID=1566289 RepID=UPI0011A51139|nr:putative porin [Lutibacter sp. Hel_I_33_5]TVZ55922.1 putative beta-barrel porin [Lutibacter sp. Hel_I_33_5]